MVYESLRPLLFRLDSEQAHHLALGLLRWAGSWRMARALLRALYAIDDERLGVRAFGVEFKNPIGLAAGYDKNGIAVRGLAALGFGHVEVGTVTLAPQPGNPRPRVWRVPERGALINRMGFPNQGVAALLAQSREWQMARQEGLRVGVNIGKGNETPLEDAADEYATLLRQVYTIADYVVLNVSSPNTSGLCALQREPLLRELLQHVATARAMLPRRVPLLIKIAPDLTDAEIDALVDLARRYGLDGVVATNTTVAREGVPTAYHARAGGLSGAPLRRRSTEIIRRIAQRTHGQWPIIGVGGIDSPASALEKLEAGATLVQLYTGFVYRGPALTRQIQQALLQSRAPYERPLWERLFAPRHAE